MAAGNSKWRISRVTKIHTSKRTDGSCDLSFSAKQTSVAKSYGATIVYNAEGEVIGMGVCITSLSRAVQKAKGKLFPFGWYHLLKSMYWGKPDTLDMLLIGVRPDWQSKGLNSLLFVDLFKRYKKMGFKYAETNANLETNAKVQAMWTPFEKELHKRRWVFGKEI